MQQFKIKSSVLCTTLKRVAAACDDKLSLPAYAGVKLELAQGNLHVSTYNPAINTESVLPLTAQEGGPKTFGMGLKLLVEVADSLQAADELEFKVGEKEVFLAAGGSRFKLNLLQDVISFPAQAMPGRTFAPLDMAKLMEAVGRVVYCHDDRTDEPYKRAVCINKDHVVSTDGFRLSHYPNRAFEVNDRILILLTTPSVERLAKIYAGFSGEAGIGCDGACLYLTCNGIYTSTRLLAGNYPNYRAILPSGPTARCDVSRKVLAESLKRSLIMVEGLKQVDFDFATQFLQIAASGTVGGSRETIEVASDANGKIRINGEFVLKALTKMNSDHVTLEYRGPNSPLILTDGEHVNVFQPIATGDGVPGKPGEARA